jgi:hypothetical protein
MTVGDMPVIIGTAVEAKASAPGETMAAMQWRLERIERLLGMSSLDSDVIDYHFANARRYREQAERAADDLAHAGVRSFQN